MRQIPSVVTDTPATGGPAYTVRTVCYIYAVLVSVSKKNEK